MKLSIITINRNNASGLRKTIESVVSQTFKDFEYIVIDGASTDESVDIIKSYSDKISYWVSESDSGIYNAMNKGIMRAKGDYVLMLNSGDYLVDDNVMKKIIPLLNGIDIIQGNLYNDSICPNNLRKGYAHSDIDFFEAYKAHINHPCTFTRRSLFDKYGFFDETYKIIADTIFYFSALALGNATFKYVDIDITVFEIDGVSDPNNKKWNETRLNELARFEEEKIPFRLVKMVKNNEMKIRVYNQLKSFKLIWFFVCILYKLSNLLK